MLLRLFLVSSYTAKRIFMKFGIPRFLGMGSVSVVFILFGVDSTRVPFKEKMHVHQHYHHHVQR